MIEFILWYITFSVVMGVHSYVTDIGTEIESYSLSVRILGSIFVGLFWPIFLGKFLGDIHNDSHKT